MSLAALHELRNIPADRETTLLNGALVYPAYFCEPPGEEEEFIIRTAMKLEYLQRFLEEYPEQGSEEYKAMASGELVPNVGQLVAVLEHVDACIKNRHPESPWSRYPEVSPEAGEVWIYDENGSDVVRAGSFAEQSPTGCPAYPFRDEKDEPILTTHWAPRVQGQAAPLPPPLL